MKPFDSHPGDVLWKFKIKDWFDSDDPVARDVLMLLAADEDLMNIERFKEILEMDRPGEHSDEITKAKWNKAQFFLLRLRLGFLHNAFKDLIKKTYKSSSGKQSRLSLENLVNNMTSKVKVAYEELRNTIDSSKTAMKAIDSFRNQASFHYMDGSFKRALDLIDLETGELIVNSTEMNLHSIVAYRVLDVVPSGLLAKETIMKIKEEIDLLQGKFHVFTVVLFDEYFSAHRLMDRITSSIRISSD